VPILKGQEVLKYMISGTFQTPRNQEQAKPNINRRREIRKIGPKLMK
jgi:hypothetical protein